jgi:hypothetical protein
MFRPTHIERTKTILIVVLFITTILLFYFLWKDTSLGGIKLPMDFLTQAENLETPKAEDLIVPASISVNFGGGLYTKVTRNTNEYWKSFRNELNKLGDLESITISEITKEQYDKVISFRSIEANFDYWLPFLESCDALGIKTKPNYSLIEAISKITYSSASPESVLIYDGKNNKYYRLAATSDVTKLNDLIINIETLETEIYYQLGEYLGVDNPTLMPITSTSKMKKINYDNELFKSTPDILQGFAESFFGKGFDFVRKITENDDTTIYMYGYGEKILIINTNGKFDYKEEYNDTAYQETSFFKSFDLAISFISTHGGWETINGNKFSSRLVSVKQTNDLGKKGYSFTFQNIVLDEPIGYEDIPYQMEISIIGNQITSYQRDILDIEQTEIDSIAQGESKIAIPPIEIISKEYIYINQILTKEGFTIIGDASDELFEYTAIRIDNIGTSYFKPSLNAQMQNKLLVPAWVIEIDNIQIYFDLFSGEPLGYSKTF